MSASKTVLRVWFRGSDRGDDCPSYTQRYSSGVPSPVVCDVFLSDAGSLRGVVFRGTEWARVWGGRTSEAEEVVMLSKSWWYMQALDWTTPPPQNISGDERLMNDSGS